MVKAIEPSTLIWVKVRRSKRKQVMVTADELSILIWVKLRRSKRTSNDHGRRTVYSNMNQSTEFKGKKRWSRWILWPVPSLRSALKGLDELVYIWLSRGSLLGPRWILWTFGSLRSALKGLDQACLHLTLSRQLIRAAIDSMTGCLLSFGLEGIGSSSFTFDTLAAAY